MVLVFDWFYSLSKNSFHSSFNLNLNIRDRNKSFLKQIDQPNFNTKNINLYFLINILIKQSFLRKFFDSHLSKRDDNVSPMLIMFLKELSWASIDSAWGI
ncbi:hypothetical protein H5410_003679 [Solanum commersonii]|uniref:Uncharacterized protein n=1 Tax=Solanum commersonii TaxID=4109 RepID=A0A9J6B5S5_SOLCO|nr:hypothetical protein H5410_003679 [Solanum commersonii]